MLLLLIHNELKIEIEKELRLCLNAAYETDYVWDGEDERGVKTFDMDWAVKLIMEKVVEKYIERQEKI